MRKEPKYPFSEAIAIIGFLIVLISFLANTGNALSIYRAVSGANFVGVVGLAMEYYWSVRDFLTGILENFMHIKIPPIIKDLIFFLLIFMSAWFGMGLRNHRNDIAKYTADKDEFLDMIERSARAANRNDKQVAFLLWEVDLGMRYFPVYVLRTLQSSVCLFSRLRRNIKQLSSGDKDVVENARSILLGWAIYIALVLIAASGALGWQVLASWSHK